MCARSCSATRGNSECKTFLRPRVPKSPYRLPHSQRPLSMTPCSSSSSPSAGCADRAPARFFKVATAPERSGDDFGILEDSRCIDTRIFQQRYLLHELVSACSELPAQHIEVSCTILSQLDWCAVRAVARCECASESWSRGADVLVRMRAWESALRCAVGLGCELQRGRSTRAPIPALEVFTVSRGSSSTHISPGERSLARWSLPTQN